MMVGNILLLAFFAIVCNAISHSGGQLSVDRSDVDFQNSRVVMKAVFGAETCADGQCLGHEFAGSRSEYPDAEGYEPQHPEPQYPDFVEPEEVYEPLHPEPQYPSVVDPEDEPLYPEQEPEEHAVTDDDMPVTYPDLCEGLLHVVNDIEASKPEIAPIKIQVLDDLIKYASAFADMRHDSCNPAVQLLDIIIAAAESLREEYRSDSSYMCEYLEEPEVTEASEEYSSGETSEAYETTEDYGSSQYPTKEPCPEGTEEPETTQVYTHEQSKEPCPVESSTMGYEPSMEPCPAEQEEGMEEEIIAEEDEEYEHHPSPPFVGSLRGVPGEHYPNYTEIPITSFSCSDKKCIPGFYADLETGCQVFHVCYEHRRESFLCPMGTIFNQPILACDFWYSSNCSTAPTYYDQTCKTEETNKMEEVGTAVGQIVPGVVESEPEYHVEEEYPEIHEESYEELAPFLPVKAKVTVFTKTDEPAEPVSQDVEEVADEIFSNIITTATGTLTKTREVLAKIPEPVETEVKVSFKKPIFKPKFFKAAIVPTLKLKAVVPMGKVLAVKKAVPVAKFIAAKAAFPVAKIAVGKLSAKAAVPIVAKKVIAGKVIVGKAAVPIVAKKVIAGKVIAAKAAVPIAAKKVIVGKAVAAKAAVPIVAKKVIAGKVFVAKAAVPVIAKGKVAVGAISVVKAKAVAVPVAAKVKIAVAAKVAAPAAAVVAKSVVAKKVIPATVAVGKKVVVKAATLPIAKAAAIKVPLLKTKILAASLPFGKSAILKASVPVKAKIFKSASIPFVKGKLMALPLAKSKLFAAAPLLKVKAVKAAVISPLTKKALAIGYMKLLKAKKLALMG